jgi:hypothetical protein
LLAISCVHFFLVGLALFIVLGRLVKFYRVFCAVRQLPRERILLQQVEGGEHACPPDIALPVATTSEDQIDIEQSEDAPSGMPCHDLLRLSSLKITQ